MDIVQQWQKWDPNPLTRRVFGDTTMSEAEIKERLKSRLQFGTAGLRGPMGAGNSYMNDLTVIQATQGLCSYLKACAKSNPDFKTGAPLRVAIAYDHRALPALGLSSEQFAKYAACVCVEAGIEAHLFEGFTATPLVPFLVKDLGMDAGIVVTASHNPKEDNGFKVYWRTGSQIIPPHDTNIANAIEANLKPWSKYEPDKIRSHSLCKDPTESATKNYFKAIKESLCRYPNENKSSSLKVVYTAMHGVGTRFILEGFKQFNLPSPLCVPDQCKPDPNFPTVQFPNPEEKGALDMAKDYAAKCGSSLVVANDPDADRLAVAEKDDQGTWRVFSGNEIGILLADWQWSQHKKHNPKCDGKNIYMLNSTVSSKMLRRYASMNGFQYADTLTGFKWMGEESYNLSKQGKTVLFTFEEAIGFCVGSVVRDKDGISAGAVFTEMACYLAREKKCTVTQHLESLYTKYGYHCSHDYYVRTGQKAVVTSIFNRLRNEGNYWFKVGEYYISNIRDLETGYDSSRVDKKAVLPKSNVLTLEFTNGGVMTLRPSGTEPKLKYYIELSGKDHKSAQEGVIRMARVLIQSMLKPEKAFIQEVGENAAKVPLKLP